MTAAAAWPVPLAHAGHVLLDLAIYVGPILVIGVALFVADRRERRRRRAEGGDDR